MQLEFATADLLPVDPLGGLRQRLSEEGRKDGDWSLVAQCFVTEFRAGAVLEGGRRTVVRNVSLTPVGVGGGDKTARQCRLYVPLKRGISACKCALKC